MSNISSNAMAQHLEILRAKALDARARDASVGELATLGNEVEEAKRELFETRAREQQERLAESVKNLQAPRIDQQHMQFQQAIGASRGNFTRGGQR